MTLSPWRRYALEEAAAGRVRGTLAERPTLRGAFEDLELSTDPWMPAPEMVAQARRALAVASEQNPPGATQGDPDEASGVTEAPDAAEMLPGALETLPASVSETRDAVIELLTGGALSGRAVTRLLGTRWATASRVLRGLEAEGSIVRTARAGRAARWKLVRSVRRETAA